MALAQKVSGIVSKEWEKEITELIGKYNLKNEDSKALRALSSKFNVSPRDVARTLQSNEISNEVWYESMKKQATAGSDRYKRIFRIASECMDYSVRPFKPKEEYRGLVSKLELQYK